MKVASLIGNCNLPISEKGTIRRLVDQPTECTLPFVKSGYFGRLAVSVCASFTGTYSTTSAESLTIWISCCTHSNYLNCCIYLHMFVSKDLPSPCRYILDRLVYK